MGIFSFIKDLFKPKKLFAYYGKVSYCKFNKQLIRTDHVRHEGGGKSTPVYRVDAIIELIFKTNIKKKFNFSLKGKSENIPFFNIRNGDFVKIKGYKDQYGFEIKELEANNQVYRI